MEEETTYATDDSEDWARVELEEEIGRVRLALNATKQELCRVQICLAQANAQLLHHERQAIETMLNSVTKEA